MAAALLEVRLAGIRDEAEGIRSLDFRAVSGGDLPPFTAGAHIDLHLPNGLVRSYSLCNRPAERHRYVVAVSRDPASRGGSRCVHEALRPGDALMVSAPRNDFPLIEDAAPALLIAGGIGITPVWCMAQHLQERGRDWQLHYCARTRRHAAFLEALQALGGRRVHVNFDQEPGGRMLDLAALVARAPADARLYCCGPRPMLAAFAEATRFWPAGRAHIEHFGADLPPPSAGGFTVELARSGRAVAVPPGSTILEALLDAGIDVPYSCSAGVCGACETQVLAGIPDHRDLVLSGEQQAANTVMMICCSGAKTDRLVLDR